MRGTKYLFLAEASGDPHEALVLFGVALARGNPQEFQAGYTPRNAALAAVDFFAEEIGALSGTPADVDEYERQIADRLAAERGRT